MTSTTLSVPAISCGHCKSSIEGAVAELSGINRVEVGIDSRQVEVDFDEAAVEIDSIIEAIEGQGYDVVR